MLELRPWQKAIIAQAVEDSVPGKGDARTIASAFRRCAQGHQSMTERVILTEIADIFDPPSTEIDDLV